MPAAAPQWPQAGNDRQPRMDKPGFPHYSGPSRSNAEDLDESLTCGLTELADVLLLADEDPHLIDASLADIHEVAARLARMVKYKVFTNPDLADQLPHWIPYDNFQQARAHENDNYEIYADDLAHHQRRRRDLAVADLDADKFAIIRRRRLYIGTLFELHGQISAIVEELQP